MSDLLWRVLYAVLVVVLLTMLIPPFFRVVGFSPSADVLLVLRIVITALAVLYVFQRKPLS